MQTAGNRDRSYGGKKSGNLKKVALAAAIFCLLQPVAYAQTASGAAVVQAFDIPAQSLAGALRAFASQSRQELLFSPEVVAGKTTQGVKGALAPSEALRALLGKTGISSSTTSNGAILLRMETASTQTDPMPQRADLATRAGSGVSGTLENGMPEPTTTDTMVVTGTRIRGGATPSPVITIGSERIREEGFTDLGGAIRSIPQNFGGGQNPGVATSANVSGNNYNATGGSSMNLRGLGQDATLTLLNGRRMSYGGASQAVDISAIPVEAVDRLEIVTDGASAVYGSDAVGGVANVILKPEFDGATVGMRFGGTTDGGRASREYTATAGTTWSSGGLIATWKKASSDPIGSDQRDFTRPMFRPATLWPSSDLRSGLLSVHQSLGDVVDLHLDALQSERRMRMDTAYSTVYYHDTPETHTTLISPSLDLQLPNDWTLTLSAAFGKDKTYTHQQVISPRTGVVSTDSIGTYGNSSQTYEVGAEGRLLTLPGGDARLAAGAGYRYNSFLSLGISSNRTVADGDESSRFAYAELSVPVVGQEQSIGGIERLVLTGAIRAEDYSTYGGVTTPKLGMIYSPSADFTLRTSWGKSFKAPRLLQRYSDQNIALYPAATFGATGEASDATVLYRAGGNAGLRPERARTWSATLAFHPEALPGLEAELSWFDIDYTGRIVQPVVPAETLVNPIYATFVGRDPTAGEMEQAIAESVRFVNYSAGTYDPDKVVAIVDNRSVNAARQRIKGVDLSGSYRFDVADGRLTVRGAASWLDSAQTTLPGQSPYDLAGTLFYPAKLSSRVGVVWMHGGFTASAFGNYTGGIRNTADDKKGASFITFDSTLRYEMGEGRGLLSNVAFELAGQNLLNRAPPLYTVTAWNETPYDSTNYSAVGRFLSLAVSKQW